MVVKGEHYLPLKGRTQFSLKRTKQQNVCDSDFHLGRTKYFSLHDRHFLSLNIRYKGDESLYFQ